LPPIHPPAHPTPLPLGDSGVASIEDLRSRTVNLVIGVSAAFGTAIIVVDAMGGVPRLALPFRVFNVTALILLYLGWFFRMRLPVGVRTWFVVLLSCGLGVEGFATTGSETYGFVMAAAYASLLLDRKRAWWVLAFGILFYAAIAGAVQLGIVQVAIPPGGLLTGPRSVVRNLLVVSWVTTLLVGIISYMHGSFLQSIRSLGQRTLELEGAIAIRDRTLSQLEVTERSYQEVFDASADALFVLDPENREVLEVNRTALSMYRHDNATGRMSFQELGWGKGAESSEDLASLVREVTEGGPRTLHWRATRGDGSEFWAEVTLKKAEIGGRLTVLGSVRDVTARLEAEAELHKHQTQLEALVAERSAALEQAQADLIVAERLAVLGQLTATVGHELRNPLGTIKNAIFSMGDALRRIDGKRAERALALAEKNVQRCDDIIHELLDFSRSPDSVMVEIAVDPWLLGVLDEEAARLPPAVTVESELHSGATLPVHQDSLRRALVNLLTNAVQAVSDLEDGRVTVATRLVEGRLEIVVSDNGPGIAAEHREKIFEPLFSTKAFGVGLGLPIVRRVAEDHGGGARIVSGDGQGASFVLWIPADVR